MSKEATSRPSDPTQRALFLNDISRSVRRQLHLSSMFVFKNSSGKGESKYPRAEHVAFSLPPIGGLKACPLKEASVVVPEHRVTNAVVPHNALFLLGILHTCESCPHQDLLYRRSSLSPKNDCPNRVSSSYKETA